MSLTLAQLREGSALGYAWFNDVLAPLWLEGYQALDYLQRRSSQHLSDLKPCEGRASALLNKQAHIQALVSVHLLEAATERQGERLLVLCERSQQQATLDAIRQFQIMEPFTTSSKPLADDVLSKQGQHKENVEEEFEEEEPACLWLAGELLPSLLQRFVNACDLSQTSFSFKENACQQYLFQGERLTVVAAPFLSTARVANLPNAVLLGSHNMLEVFLESLTTFLLQEEMPVLPLPQQERRVYELEVGVPRFGLTYQGNTLLPETGLESWTVSYSKGCYLGQETVARVKTYGSVPQLLVGLVFAEQPQPVMYAQKPMALYLSGESKPIGHLLEVLYSEARQVWLASAYLGKAHRVPGQTLQLHFHPNALPSATSPAFSATVHWLPFVGESPSLQAGVQGKSALSASLQEILNLAMRQFLEGESEAALSLLQKTRNEHPACHELSETLGVLLGRLNRYEEAMAVMQAIIAQEPTWVMAYTNLSRFALALGNKELAETYKAQATTAAMKRHMQQAMVKKALAGVVATAELPSSEAQLAKQAETDLKRHQQLQERAALFRHALQFNETDPLAHYGLATTLLDLDEPAQALPHLQRTIALHPKQSQAYLSLAQAYEQTGSKAEAFETLKQGLAVASARGDKQPLQQIEAKLAAWTS